LIYTCYTEIIYTKKNKKKIGISIDISRYFSFYFCIIFQVECHPYLTQNKLSNFCKERDILITAYSPLGSPDRPWAKPDDPKLLDDKKLIDLGKKYNKTPAQILIRYQVYYNVNVSSILYNKLLNSSNKKYRI